MTTIGTAKLGRRRKYEKFTEINRYYTKVEGDREPAGDAMKRSTATVMFLHG